jgi:ABC-type multidrug transport system fused ATPase/permease subunit
LLCKCRHRDNRGEIVALVVRTVRVRPRVAKVIAGLYEPAVALSAGYGVDVRSYRPDLFRERVAIIFQDFVR